MWTTFKRRIRLASASLVAGSVFLLGSCDPTLQTTVENGIINTSTALLNSLVQATIQLYQENP